jgi:hypothetical protein
VDQTPALDYGSGTRRSEYGDPNDAWGQAGNRLQNFAQGAAKTAAALAPAALIPGIGPGLVAIASGIGGIWNTFTAEADLNKNRAVEIQNATRARTEFLEGKQYLTDVEERQLKLYDTQIAKLRQDYENSKGLQASILARQQQAAQQGYGGALGATGMSYAAAQPGLMRGLAARGMLGTGAEASARGALAGQRASDIATAAQNYSTQMSQAYQSDAQTRGRLLSALSTGETTIDTARTKFNNDMAAAQFQLNQGNRQEADRLADQAAKDYAATQQQRGSDIFQGVTAVATSPEFKTAMGAAFGPAKAAAGGLTRPPILTPDFSAPTVGPTPNATVANFTGGLTRPPIPTPDFSAMTPGLTIDNTKLPSQLLAKPAVPLQNMQTRDQLAPFSRVNPLDAMTMKDIPYNKSLENQFILDAIPGGLGQRFLESLPTGKKTGVPFNRYTIENGKQIQRPPIRDRAKNLSDGYVPNILSFG